MEMFGGKMPPEGLATLSWSSKRPFRAREGLDTRFLLNCSDILTRWQMERQAAIDYIRVSNTSNTVNRSEAVAVSPTCMLGFSPRSFRTSSEA